MINFKLHHSLLLCGGRSEQQVFNDLFLLTLDNLVWVRVEVQGPDLQRRTNFCMLNIDNDNKVFILGGMDYSFKLNNRVNFVVFEKEFNSK